MNRKFAANTIRRGDGFAVWKFAGADARQQQYARIFSLASGGNSDRAPQAERFDSLGVTAAHMGGAGREAAPGNRTF